MIDCITKAAMWLADQPETMENKFAIIQQRFGLTAPQAAQALTKANQFRMYRRAHG